jgi:hypothetical protein
MHRRHSTHPRVAASRTHEETLPLFAWADSRQDNHQSVHLPRAARFVARRFGLPPTRAHVVAELAGYPMEAGNA